VSGRDGRCFGLAADEATLMVCSYGANGTDPELLLYRHTCA